MSPNGFACCARGGEIAKYNCEISCSACSRPIPEVRRWPQIERGDTRLPHGWLREQAALRLIRATEADPRLPHGLAPISLCALARPHGELRPVERGVCGQRDLIRVRERDRRRGEA